MGILAASDVDDVAGHALVTAYAVSRPDEQWALMAINKDQLNAHAVRVEFGANGYLNGPVSIATFGSEQYQWHPTEKGGYADPDGPLARSTLRGGEDSVYTLPKASVTVIRGKVIERH